MIENQLHWASPIVYGEIENKNLCDKTANYIIENLNEFRPNLKNYVVGSEDILLKHDFSEFMEKIAYPAFEFWTEKNLNKKLKDFRNLRYKAWTTNIINENRSFPIHNHSGSSLSAVFYILNSGGGGGEIIFYDPRFNANRAYDKKIFDEFFGPKKFNTETYKFVVFPGFLYHEVTPFQGKMRLAFVVDIFIN